jgi:alpha-galactosidase
MTIRAFVGLTLTAALSAQITATGPRFRTWAATPPMGWNSWDSFGTAITEAQTREQAAFMAARLKPHGWQYIVVDIQWYEPEARGHGYRADATLTMDEFGRLTPAVNRFPSAAGGHGFKPLADYVHSLGLKFGIHLMRGIPRQAVRASLPVEGTTYRADQIGDPKSICPWNPDMFGIDMSRKGAQEYYDSVFQLLASWGVDYVKVDDIARPYYETEVAAVRRAIDRTGRPMVLSLSPGETPLSAAPHVTRHANLWRISDDFWDRWLALYEQFGRLDKWNPHRVEGAWPDADMLPLGTLGQRQTRFTRDEQLTMMSLWAIARSPLMHGGDMTKSDEFTLSLLTNDEVIAVNQRSANNRPLFNRDELIGWTADVPGSRDKYLAFFNARDRIRVTPPYARYRSAPVGHDASTAAAIDVDIKGAKTLVLVVDPTDGGGTGDSALWIEPTLVLSDGRTQPLTELQWTHADALWDSASVRRSTEGRALTVRGRRIEAALSTLAASRIEYALPPDVVRFTATGAIDERVRPPAEGGTVRFVVATGPQADDAAAGVRISVALRELRLTGSVSARDLWARRAVGTFRDSFAVDVPFHGAALYRLSPAAQRAP